MDIQSADKSTYPWLPATPQWDMEIVPRLMPDIFDDMARTKPKAPAFDFMGKISNWGTLQEKVNAFAAGLQHLGIQKGDRVGIFLPNCPLYLIAYYGILKAGAVVVNFNPLYAPRELAHQITDSGTRIMVTLDLKMLCDSILPMIKQTGLEKVIVGQFADMLPFPQNLLFPVFKCQARARIVPSASVLRLESVLRPQGPFTPVVLDPCEDLAVLQYTGGTTGTPKGAMLTHANIHANAVQCYAAFPKAQGHEIMMGVLPFFHVFAMTVTLNMAVMAGMEIVTLPRFDLDHVLKIIHRKKPHYMPAVPAVFSAINNHPRLKAFDLSSLKFCISGGAPLPQEVKRQFESKTGCIVVEGYGLTEASPVATVNPLSGDNIAGSIGLPLPQTVIEIMDVTDKMTPMPLGERGELCIRGPQVMRGYWNNPEASADVLRPASAGGARLHTGDIAIMDARGYVYIVDRIKDMIITNGYNVYPRNIEEAIYLHSAVEECIVAGLPDLQRGEIVKAWVRLKTGYSLTEEELLAFLNDKISKIEMPKRIEFRSTPLPKTMIGKLSRKDIVAEELQGTSITKLI